MNIRLRDNGGDNHNNDFDEDEEDFSTERDDSDSISLEEDNFSLIPLNPVKQDVQNNSVPNNKALIIEIKK